MKLCKRGVNFIQIIDAKGNVRVCGWNRNNIIGSLLEDDLHTIYHNQKAETLRKDLIDQRYTNCPVDNCPYLANGSIENNLIELDEIPQYPSALYLAYEGNCNYKCTCCTSFQNMLQARERDWSENYEKIENSIRDILPHIKHIGANGRGELFASPRILKILGDWNPISPIDEVSVSLETNGSLFNEKNWKKIENLGKYYLRVAITVMSFQNEVYQYLSGTELHVNNLISNLKFVKELRHKGVINHLEIATVLQEQNFREMPEFVKRCLEEFGADSVRIRPIMAGGPLDPNIQWFMDVRNPRHPFYKEYKRVMQNSVFKNPKVLLWSGELDSIARELPGVIGNKKNETILNQIDKLCDINNIDDIIESHMKERDCKKLVIYGVGRIGKIFIRRLNNNIVIPFLIDNYKAGNSFADIDILDEKDAMNIIPDDTMILITIFDNSLELQRKILELNPKVVVLLLRDILK